MHACLPQAGITPGHSTGQANKTDKKDVHLIGRFFISV